MQHNCCNIAQTLLAVTLSAISSVDGGDWEMAGQLLRRRDQLLTQLEAQDKLDEAADILRSVQKAEAELAEAMEAATREALMNIHTARDARNARKAYMSRRDSSGLIERVG